MGKKKNRQTLLPTQTHVLYVIINELKIYISETKQIKGYTQKINCTRKENSEVVSKMKSFK
jgi:hypothetical protein